MNAGRGYLCAVSLGNASDPIKNRPRLRGVTVQVHSFKFHKIILHLCKIASGAQDQCVIGSGVMFWFTAFWV